jgi:hypothetical protein
MRWDDRLGELFDDLEQQAEGLALSQRDAEVAELARAEYAQVDLAARLHGSLGRRLVLEVEGFGVLDGVLSRVGSGWCLLGTGSREWLVRLAATGSLRGLVERGLPAEGRPVTARLGLASALRRVAETQAEVVLHRVDGTTMRGRPLRVGADFLDLRTDADGAGPESAGPDSAGPDSVRTVPFSALALVRAG